jgi:PAS domain S-box-containing protein
VKSEKLSGKNSFKNSITARIIFWIFLGMGILCLIFMTVHYDTFKRLLEAKNEQYVSNLIDRITHEKMITAAGIVKKISTNIELFRYIEVFEVVDKMVQQDETVLNAYIIDTNGYVHHQTKPTRYIQLQKKDTHDQTLLAGLTVSELFSKEGQTYLECTVPIVIQYDVWGMLKLVFQLNTIDREQKRLNAHLRFLLFSNMIWIFGVWISGMISIGIVLLIIMSRHSRRLIQMGRQIEDFKQESQNLFISLSSRPDETGFLANQIYHTFSLLNKKVRTIQSEYNQLNESYEDSYQITEKTRTLLQEVQAGLKEWDYQFRTVFGCCQESLLFINCQGKILEANQSFLKLSGYSLQDIQNIEFVQLIPKDWQSTFTQTFMRQIQTQTQTQPAEIAILCKDHSYLYLSIAGRLLFKHNTEPHKILIAGIELSWKKQMQYMLNDLELLLKEDLKDSLGRVIGLSELMAVKTQVGKKDLIDWSQIIHQNARKMLDMLQQALDIFKIEADAYALNCRQCNLNNIFQKITTDFSSILLTRSLEIHFTMNDDPIFWDQVFEIWGDCNLLHVMFSLLIGDIIEQSPDKQKITISLQQETDLHVSIQCQLPLSENILNNFFIRPADASKQHKGAYTAMLIAKAHGGTLGIRSSTSQSTQFILILPDNKSTANKCTFTKRLLIADDSPNNHLLLEYYLSDFSDWFKVFANNGQEAVEQFQEMPFDVILMDIEMPELDGISAIKAIREIEKNMPHRTQKLAQIFVMTADNSDETKTRVIDAGANALIVKPIDAEQLIELINISGIDKT